MKKLHPWSLTPEEAVKLQGRLRKELVLSSDDREIRTIAGVDVGISGEFARAAIVVLRFPGLELLETASARIPISFPYIPGLLSFREGPVVLQAWENLKTKPDLVIFDGQGTAHPRQFGLACHLGLWLRCPSIGAAKSHLYGTHAQPGAQLGSWTEIFDEHQPGSVIGAVLRTRDHVKPLYISPGHLMDLEHALHYVMMCCCDHRLPEPTRLAHLASKGEPLLERTENQPRIFSLHKA
jgi:deoxyribonuclease V